MNKVELIGRLARDPDIRYTTGPGDPMCIARYTLAVDRRYRKQDGSTEADFISCVAFGKAGEFVEKYLKKGMKIAITGRIQTGSYEKDGRKIYTTDVVAEEQEFCESKASRGQQAQSNGQGQQAPEVNEDGFMDIPEGIDEELPFALGAFAHK